MSAVQIPCLEHILREDDRFSVVRSLFVQILNTERNKKEGVCLLALNHDQSEPLGHAFGPHDKPVSAVLTQEWSPTPDKRHPQQSRWIFIGCGPRHTPYGLPLYEWTQLVHGGRVEIWERGPHGRRGPAFDCTRAMYLE